MKKQLTNIETIKAMVNANVLECVELKQWSVQVYNLNEYEEYTNIYKVEKINGRYYMFDLADKKYMMCRQRDAEWFAGEFLHFVERERETVAAYVESIKKYGKTCINEAYYIPFTDALDAEGIEYRPIVGTLGWCNQGYVVCCYEITNRPTEPQTATEGENEPQTTNTPQSDRNAATAELFAVSLEVVECLRDIETLTPEEAADKYPAGLLAQAEQLGQLEEWAELSNPRFNRDRPTGTRAEMVETLQRFNPDTMARAAV